LITIFEKFKDSKFKIGDPVRLKGKGTDIIFYIDQVIGTMYHIEDDKFIYRGYYQEEELEKLSDEEIAILKYNL